MMKVLFIGGSGNISSSVSRMAIERGIELTLLNRGKTKADIAGGVGYDLDTCWYNPNGVENNQGIRATYEIKDLAQLLTVVW